MPNQVPSKSKMELLPFEMDYLPEFFKQKAEEEINYSNSIIEKSLGDLKEYIANDDTLKGFRISDELLLIFLTCRKFDIGKTHEHVKKFTKFRRNNPVMFITPPFDVLSVFMTSELVTVLPWRCQEGCSIIYIQLGKLNSVQHPVDAIKQFYTLLMLQCLRQPMTQVNGFKAIIDLDISMDAMRICTPRNMYLFVYGVLVVSPGRVKAVHILNMGGIGKALWNLCTLFLPGKIKKRAHFHKNNDLLLDFFSKEVLPQKLGGDLRDYDMTKWLKKYSSVDEQRIFAF